MSTLLLLLAVPAAGRTHAVPAGATVALCNRAVTVPRLPHTWRPTGASCTTCTRLAERTVR